VARKMRVSLKLLESDSVIRKHMLDNIKVEFNKGIDRSIPKILAKVKETLSLALKAEPEYQSLINGNLRLEFGIPDTSVVDKLIDEICDTANIQKNTITSSSTGLKGGFILTVLSSSGEPVINSNNAMVTDSKGYSLPWLKWLLFEGSKPLIKNYSVKFGPNSRSRTGQAIMISSTKNWRVPSEFSGTVTNNWITRAIDRISDKILQDMQNIIESNL
jgi:hypothetical protein